MTDQLARLVMPASRLLAPTLPVHEAFDGLVALRPGTTTEVGGCAATSLALSLAAKASETSWVAIVGLPNIGLSAAKELGVDLDHVVVVSEQTIDVFAAVLDAFDLVIASPPPQRKAGHIQARARERDACLLVLGRMPGSDLTVVGSNATWHGIGDGHGHLAARTVTVTVAGRRGATRPRERRIWLPDAQGEIRAAERLRAIG